MTRRQFLQRAPLPLAIAAAGLADSGAAAFAAEEPRPKPARFIDSEIGMRWRAQWEKQIVGSSRTRYCDKELGEELGWLVSPYLNGYFYGFVATRDPRWVGMLVDWTDACIRRATKDPDGFRGWPKGNGGGGDSTEYTADSLLGEAMMLRPVVLMSGIIRDTPALQSKYGDKARAYLDLADEIFRKWEARQCWRDVRDGGIWVVPDFGIDKKSGGWSAGHATRSSTGFSNPDNKANHIARWHLAMADVTGKAIYRQRAESWFRLMKSRMKTREDGRYFVWNYWEPAGPWDYKPDRSPKHWVGVHPNGGYYSIDAEGIVDAYEHQLVFGKDDLARLVATNRDFMWNKKVEGAQFQRIDGREPDARWKNSPGTLWSALVPHDATLRDVFIANQQPASWGGLASTPWFLALDAPKA